MLMYNIFVKFIVNWLELSGFGVVPLKWHLQHCP